jgi:hypothetical protein
MQLRSSWQDVARRIDGILQDSDYEAVKSFDLQLARQELQDPSSRPCPYQGTAECTCQYLRYRVYADGAKPLALVLHGYDNQTQMTMETESDEEHRLICRHITQDLLQPGSP